MPGCVLRGAVGVIKHGWYRDTCKGAAAGAPRQHTIGMLWLLACVRVRVNMRESGSRKHGPRYARCRACRAHTAGDPLGQCVRVCVCASCVRACTHNRPIIPRTHQTRARAHTPTCPPVAAVRRACACSSACAREVAQWGWGRVTEQGSTCNDGAARTAPAYLGQVWARAARKRSPPRPAVLLCAPNSYSVRLRSWTCCAAS